MRRTHRDRYEVVFVILIASFVLGAVFTSAWARVCLLVLYATALLLALRAARLSRRSSRLLRAALALGSLVIGLVAVAVPGRGTEEALALWLAAVLLTTIIAIIWRLLHHQTVSLQTIFAALSAYLLIGFFFAAVYGAVATLGSAPFFAAGQQAVPSVLQYFSFVTMTTTGYGDYTPLGSVARSLAVLEALLGQIFLVTLVARLVTMFGRQRPRPGSAPEAG